ncbi:hypothetical protein D3C81_1290330 [compost metagenome]
MGNVSGFGLKAEIEHAVGRIQVDGRRLGNWSIAAAQQWHAAPQVGHPRLTIEARQVPRHLAVAASLAGNPVQPRLQFLVSEPLADLRIILCSLQPFPHRRIARQLAIRAFAAQRDIGHRVAAGAGRRGTFRRACRVHGKESPDCNKQQLQGTSCERHDGREGAASRRIGARP